MMVDLRRATPDDIDALVALACAMHDESPRFRLYRFMPDRFRYSLGTVMGLSHGFVQVAEIDGVRWVNDSKATNVDAAAKALTAFQRIRWIAGGMGKDGGIEALAPHLGQVLKAYFIGHSARDFALQVGQTPYEITETMEQAVSRAAAEAQPGETVLLAPAAASFDQYPNFEKRGEHFTALVQALKP